jgi:predicted MFS family arabinose efflux permease
VAGVFFETALTVAVRDLVSEARLVRVNSRLELANRGSMLAGPALLALLASAVGLSGALAVNAFTFAISFISLLTIRFGGSDGRPGLPGKRSLFPGLGHDLREGLRFVRSHRVLLTVACLQATVNFLFAAESLLVFYTKDHLALATSTVGLVVIAGAAGGITGAAVAARLARRVGEERLLVVTAGLLGGAIAGFSLARSPVPLAVANLMLAATDTIATVAIRSIRLRVVPRALLGRVTSSGRVLALSAHHIGTIIAGALTAANFGDPRPIFLLAGVLVAAAANVSWWAGLRQPDAPNGLGPDAHCLRRDRRLRVVDELPRADQGTPG